MGPLAFLLRSFVLDVVLQSRPSSHLQHFVEIGHVPGEIGETVTLRFAQLAAHRGGSLSVFGSAEVTATAAMADAPGPVPSPGFGRLGNITGTTTEARLSSPTGAREFRSPAMQHLASVAEGTRFYDASTHLKTQASEAPDTSWQLGLDHVIADSVGASDLVLWQCCNYLLPAYASGVRPDGILVLINATVRDELVLREFLGFVPWAFQRASPTMSRQEWHELARRAHVTVWQRRRYREPSDLDRDTVPSEEWDRLSILSPCAGCVYEQQRQERQAPERAPPSVRESISASAVPANVASRPDNFMTINMSVPLSVLKLWRPRFEIVADDLYRYSLPVDGRSVVPTSEYGGGGWSAFTASNAFPGTHSFDVRVMHDAVVEQAVRRTQWGPLRSVLFDTVPAGMRQQQRRPKPCRPRPAVASDDLALPVVTIAPAAGTTRVLIVDLYPKAEVDGQRTIFLEQIKRLTSTVDIEYLLLSPSPRRASKRPTSGPNGSGDLGDLDNDKELDVRRAGTADLEDRIVSLGGHTRAFPERSFRRMLLRVHGAWVGGADLRVGSTKTKAPSTAWARSVVDKPDRSLLDGLLRYLSGFTVVVMGNRNEEADDSLFLLAALAGVPGRFLELSLLDPPRTSAATAFLAPSQFACCHESVRGSLRALAPADGAELPNKMMPMPCVVMSPGIDLATRFNGSSANSLTKDSLDGTSGGDGRSNATSAPHMVSPHVVSVGRLSSEKNPGLLVRAFAVVQQALPGTLFTIVGDGRMRDRIERLAEALEVRVSFKGHLYETLPSLLETADVFVAASTFPETFAIVNIEALAMGVPVVNFAVGGMAEYMCSEVGIVPNEPTAQALAASILALVANETLATQLGKRGKDLVRKGFSSEKSAAAYARLYSSCSTDSGTCTELVREVRGDECIK